MEEKVIFGKEDQLLEGLFYNNTENTGKAIIICHPHPLYGGSMDNKIVHAIHNIFSKMGFSTLRFNFRSVGNSEGSFDSGNGEVLDIQEAKKFLLSKVNKLKTIFLAGYSFGSFVASKYATKDILSIEEVILIAPPLQVFSFNHFYEFPGRKLIVIG